MCTEVQLNERVRLFNARTQDAARPVIFEPTRDHSKAAREQRGSCRISLHTSQRPAVESELDEVT